MFSHLIQFAKNRQCLAVGAIFLIMGALFGNWATLIPYIKSKYNFDDGQLGLIILCLPIGAALANPLSTWFIHKYGMQRMTMIGVVCMCVFYVLPVGSVMIWGVVAGLFLTGSSIAFTNVSMNTCASALEHQLRLHIMSTCHGLFSLGLMLGSLISSTMIGFKVLPVLQSGILSSILLLIAWGVRAQILTIHDDHPAGLIDIKPKFTFPSGALLVMIGIALCTNLTEGAMADWSAVYMRDVVHSAAYFIGWGLASYSFCMATGRFFGDYIIPKYGANKVLAYGGCMSIVGIVTIVLCPSTLICILAFGLVGFGVSCGAPILYGSAARLPGLGKGVGLATLNTFSVASFLGGPVIIGFISSAVNLQFGLGFVGLAGLLWVYLTTKIKL